MFKEDVDSTSFGDHLYASVTIFCDNETKNILKFLCCCLFWLFTWLPSQKFNEPPPQKFNGNDKEFVKGCSIKLIKKFNEHMPQFIEMYNCQQ